MIKAVFFDLDGTLLSSKKFISQSAVTMLKTCRDQNIKLFTATARTPDLDKSLGWNVETLSLFDGGVFCNGAINILDNRAEYNFINSEVINRIVKTMRSYPNINLALQSTNNVHAFNNKLSKTELVLWGTEENKIFSTENISYEKILLEIRQYSCGVVPNTEQIILRLNCSIYFPTVPKLMPKQVINILSKTCGKLARVYVTDEGRVIQVGSIEASKYNGVESIRKRLGIKKNEVAVFGDDINDLEMISGYENSVAMGNAVPEIKAAARFVTNDNDDDGIAFAIEKFVIGNVII